MTMRSALYQLLSSDEDVAAIVGDRIHGTSGIDGEDDQMAGIERPFIILRCSGTYPGPGNMEQMSAEVWVHQEPGSYLTVDAVLKIVKARLKNLTPFSHDGAWIVDAIYTQTSPDLYDQPRRTNCRMAAFTITGNEA